MAKERKISSKGANPTGGSPSPEDLPMGRQLIVIARREAGVRATREGIASVAGADITPLADFLTSEGIILQPLFGVSEEKLRHEATSFTAATGVELPDLSIYYRVQAPDERLDELAKRLRKLETVEAAYVKPAPELPQMLNDMAPSAEEAPPATPDFTPRQGYLDAALGGIDARYAWTLPGGGGQGVRIIDIEGAWRFTHEDLLQNQGGVVGGTMSTSSIWRNHGTAVVGEFGGDRNNSGITGICPDANVRAISIYGQGQSDHPESAAIRQAADMLSAGDIILIELHYPGPRFNYQIRGDQKGYIAVEWWPDSFDAICYATSKGIIVVEAAGNGAENLDDAIYNTRPAGFPASWTNPFNRVNRDSGAIVVGAGNPPAGIHGRNAHPTTGEAYVDRARCGFSNYGGLIDAQGWGWEVTSTGYGDLQGGSNEDFWYTDQFSGTSSASPIVVGAIGCVQGVLRARGKPPLTPAKVRQCLRTTGSPQQDATGRPSTQRIGNRPNLRQLISCATGKTFKEIKDRKEIKEGKEFKEKDRKEIKELKEFKEKDRKEIKELKEFKEKDRKEIKELKEFREKDKEREDFPIQPTEPISIEERLTRVETAVVQLAHFIGIELRPDLSESSLTQEPDLAALSQQLQKQAADAKQAKDNKDIEKLSEV